MSISSQEFNDYGGMVSSANRTPASPPPLPYTKGTRTSFGRSTSWQRQSGMGISKQASGSFLSFDDDSTPALPKSDTGSSFGKA
jgi:hypothetical protein